MKIFQRIKNYANNSIICKVEVDKPNKSECKLFVESLNKDGDILSTTVEKISYSEITKLIDVFSSKMKKFAFLNTTPTYIGHEVETQMFINPELTEKERVGFELYGPFSDKNANTNLVAYYSFSDTGIDFRQQLIHDNIFGFFSLNGFETPFDGLKNTFLTYGITYVDIEELENYSIIMTSQEYERQYKKEVEEPRKRTRKKTIQTLPPEVIQLKEQLENKEEKVLITDENLTTNVADNKENTKALPIKKRGRKPKEIDEQKIEIKESSDSNISEETPQTPPKRGRGRPPKNS